MSKSQGRTCILLPTFSRYLPLARITHHLLSIFWPGHPPVFIAGVENYQDEKATCLPIRSDAKEWTSILADACDDLISSGFSNVYLILDDHPPVNSCHAEHLNSTIPRLRESLDATYIALNGWGYGRSGRRINGDILTTDEWNLERVGHDFTWKASLHPGLWSLQRLAYLSRTISRTYPTDRRTAWAFERIVGGERLAADFDCTRSFYRVCGRCMTDRRTRYFRYRFAYAFVGLLRSLAHRLPVDATPLNRVMDALGYYYEGPYPLFWSGMVSQGRVNPAFLRYAALLRRRDLYPLIRQQIPTSMFESG